jgi:hypothetical protein
MTRDEHLQLIAMEEAVEVALALAQRIAKSLRFGMDQVQKDPGDAPEQNPDGLTNRERIRKEYSDLAAMLEMIGIGAPLGREMDAKREKVERYLLRSASCGTLKEI